MELYKTQKNGTKSVLFYCSGGAIGADGAVFKCPYMCNKKILNYFFSHTRVLILTPKTPPTPTTSIKIYKYRYKVSHVSQGVTHDLKHR